MNGANTNVQFGWRRERMNSKNFGAGEPCGGRSLATDAWFVEANTGAGREEAAAQFKMTSRLGARASPLQLERKYKARSALDKEEANLSTISFARRTCG